MLLRLSYSTAPNRFTLELKEWAAGATTVSFPGLRLPAGAARLESWVTQGSHRTGMLDGRPALPFRSIRSRSATPPQRSVIAATSEKKPRLRAELMPQFTGTLW